MTKKAFENVKNSLEHFIKNLTGIFMWVKKNKNDFIAASGRKKDKTPAGRVVL